MRTRKVASVERKAMTTPSSCMSRPRTARPRCRGTHLLVAAGRKANVDGLDLEKARIRHHRGGIEVNSALRTSNRRVYAIGDVAGGLQFTHVAGYHAGLVVQSILFRIPGRENRDIVPWATYTDPELAHVGLTEEEARKRGKRPLRLPLALSGERPRPRRGQDRWPAQAGHRPQGPHSRRDDCRRRSRRDDQSVRARRRQKDDSLRHPRVMFRPIRP